jgi:hypothetical protein
VPPRPHYLPAAFIAAGFGTAPKPGEELRMGRVTVRMKDPDKILRRVTADSICHASGLYDVQNPTPQLAADYADQWWAKYESALPRAAAALEAGSAGAQEWQTILMHLQATHPRHLDFGRDAIEQKANQGVTGITGDAVEELRQAVLEENGSMLAKARFALLRRHRHAEPFLLNDKGYTSFADIMLGVFFPLTREIGVLMAVDAAEPGEPHDQAPYAERSVNARGVAYLNARGWEHSGITRMIAHPDDEELLTRLADRGEVGMKTPNRLRPYRLSREQRMLEWAWA